jgi:protein-ribulosamine 3-kinase
MLARIPSAIQREISVQLKCTLAEFDFASGGCINSGGRLQTSNGIFFLKWNSAERYPGMFLTEAEGLKLLRSSTAIKIPEVVLTGSSEGFQFLVLEFISQAKPSHAYWQKLGEQLAELHRKTSSHYGLSFDNYIGSLPQHNSKNRSWTTFFIEQRLAPQLELSVKSGKLETEIARKFERLYEKLPELIVEEKPSLLHGDLWSGNLIIDDKGGPCLIDPAIFYGNREAELAFTRLFGGFSPDFYASYQSNFPLEKGFESRIDLYNLYPLMVHLNLFGQGYQNQVVSILKNYV